MDLFEFILLEVIQFFGCIDLLFLKSWEEFGSYFFKYLCPFLFSFWNSCHSHVSVIDGVLQVSCTLFISFHSFFFLLLRLENFSCSSFSVTKSAFCVLNLLCNLSSEFFKKIFSSTNSIWFPFEK